VSNSSTFRQSVVDEEMMKSGPGWGQFHLRLCFDAVGWVTGKASGL